MPFRVSVATPSRFCAVLALAGCSGGGGGGPGGGGVSYGDYVARNTAIRSAAEGLPPVMPDDLPATGSLTYAGTAGFLFGVTPATSDRYFGEIRMTVDFDQPEAVRGRIDNIASGGNLFTREGAGPVAGALVMSNGSVARVLPDPRFNPYILADLDGTLTHDGLSRDVRGRLEGRFVGDDYDFIQGSLVTREPRPLEPVLTGSFNAERED